MVDSIKIQEYSPFKLSYHGYQLIFIETIFLLLYTHHS